MMLKSTKFLLILEQDGNDYKEFYHIAKWENR